MDNTTTKNDLRGKNFLLLQGPIGPFFAYLANGLESVGASVLKVNFNGGGEYFHKGYASVNFEDKLENLPNFLLKLVAAKNITDLIVYGDCRPLHKVSIAALKPLGIKIHVLEEGYFRPDWITMEEDGVNYYSALPREADFYFAQKKIKLPESTRIKANFRYLVKYSILYYIYGCKSRLQKRFAHYIYHFECGPHRAFWSWLPRLFSKYIRGIQAKAQVEKILHLKYFLVPLQLCRDFQVREHSNFKGMPDFTQYVITEFAKHAEKDTYLVIKKHPLDAGLIGLRKLALKTAANAGVKNRVIFIDGGNLPQLLDASLGVITVNSTAGLQAIHHKAPVLVLGRCFYDIQGLVNKVDIKTFLQNPQRSDDKLYKHFRNYVMRKTQINGGFYNQPGINLAVAGVVKKLLKQNKCESLPLNYPEFLGSQIVS